MSPICSLPLSQRLTTEFALYKAFPLLSRLPNQFHQRPRSTDLAHAHFLDSLDPSQNGISDTLFFSLNSCREHGKKQTGFGIATLLHSVQRVDNLSHSILHFACGAREVVNPSK